MNLAESCLRRRVVVVVLSLVVVFAGLQAYRSLGRLEDPAFPLKQAVVIARYPGATPEEVADEVADPIEAAIQQLDQVDYVTSRCTAGQAMVKVFIKDQYGAEDLPQVWDELRRKVTAARASLPPGCPEPIVNDDFGDVYGVLFYVYGDGYSLAELHDYVRDLRKELLLVDGVGSVSLLGAPQEIIAVDVLAERYHAGIVTPQTLGQALQGQSETAQSGQVAIGPRRVNLAAPRSLDSVEAIRNLYVTPPLSAPVALGEVAKVTRQLDDPPSTILRYNGFPAIAVGVATVDGGNVVSMGQAVQERLDQLRQQRPLGVELGVVSMQSESVRQAVRGFSIGLVESVAIVIGVLLVAMGLRAGLLIGGILVLTIMGTFIGMQQLSVDLQRISLGALIIALGMLVDNAIVVVEGIVAGARQGLSRAEAARQIVGQTTWPLLGATVIAVLAFAPIGVSPDSTGDYCGSLFTVIWVSLGLSWLFAITSTPVFGAMVLTKPKGAGGEDPYSGRLFRTLRKTLEFLLARRWISLGVLALLLLAALIGFAKARQGFFPSSARPQFLVDLWMPEGTAIEQTDQQAAKLARWLREQEGVRDVAASIGTGTLRFELTYSPESPNSSYAQLMVSVDSAERIDPLMQRIQTRLRSHHPAVQGWPWRMVLGPGGEAKIQARLRGPDPDVLRGLAQKVSQKMAAEPYARDIRTDWRDRALTVQPKLEQAQMARRGVTRANLLDAMQIAFDGKPVGLYRESEQAIPVVFRSRVAQPVDVGQLPDVLVATSAGPRIPISQLADGQEIVNRDPIIHRRNREATITVMCDPAAGSAAELLARLRPDIEAISLPVGYTLQWGGEYEKANKANAGLTALMPICFGGMVLILIGLFNNLRQPLIILLTVPLAIIGVTIGLLSTGAEFGFMPILGVLSLTGMLIKNSIVLIDEANAQTAAGASHYEAIIRSAVSRARPVAMAALTTVLGMIPLLTDIFFRDMAIVIMFGLAFATVLTLLVVPLLYAVFYKAHPQQKAT